MEPEPKNENETPMRAQPVDYGAGPSTGGTMEGWVSLALGVLLLLIFPRFMQWGASRTFGSHFNEFLDPAGTVVPYQQVPEFWADLGPTLFGLMLILEGAALALRRRVPGLLWLAIAFAGLTVLYNLGYAVMSYSKYGIAIVSVLAVIVGVPIVTQTFRLVRRVP